jgi:protein SCO1
MNKVLKAGLLTVTLALPAFIVIFLNLFGNNHFKLPYMVPKTDEQGNVMLTGKDTIFYQVPNPLGTIQVLAFYDSTASEKIQQQFTRVVNQRLGGVDVHVVQGTNEEIEKTAIKLYRLQPLKNAKTKETIPYYGQFTLIDKEGYIRGFYDGSNPDDVDRLLAETKVLLDIYKKQ